jgi:hypothetical protein
MNRIATVAWLVSFAVVPRIWAGPPGDIPLAHLVAKSDLIVIGKITSKVGPEKRLVCLPQTDDKVEFESSEYQVAIEKVLLNRQQPLKTQKVTVIARDGSPAPDLQMPQLKEDVAYVLLLQRLPDDPGKFYLPDYFKHYLTATDEHIQTVQQALVAH